MFELVRFFEKSTLILTINHNKLLQFVPPNTFFEKKNPLNVNLENAKNY